MPESVANTSVQVMYETSVPGQARLEEVCATLSLEVHTSCNCGCQQLECSSKQVSSEGVSRGETVIILSSRSLMTEPVSADALTLGPEASASCNTIRSVKSAISIKIEMMKTLFVSSSGTQTRASAGAGRRSGRSVRRATPTTGCTAASVCR